MKKNSLKNLLTKTDKNEHLILKSPLPDRQMPPPLGAWYRSYRSYTILSTAIVGLQFEYRHFDPSLSFPTKSIQVWRFSVHHTNSRCERSTSWSLPQYHGLHRWCYWLWSCCLRCTCQSIVESAEQTLLSKSILRHTHHCWWIVWFDGWSLWIGADTDYFERYDSILNKYWESKRLFFHNHSFFHYF